VRVMLRAIVRGAACHRAWCCVVLLCAIVRGAASCCCVPSCVVAKIEKVRHRVYFGLARTMYIQYIFTVNIRHFGQGIWQGYLAGNYLAVNIRHTATAYLARKSPNKHSYMVCKNKHSYTVCTNKHSYLIYGVYKQTLIYGLYKQTLIYGVYVRLWPTLCMLCFIYMFVFCVFMCLPHNAQHVIMHSHEMTAMTRLKSLANKHIY
jgi:hypothetical protein